MPVTTNARVSRPGLHPRFAVVLTLLMAASSVIIGQSTHGPWMEMSKKDAEKLLADSPWSQTQVDTDTSEMFFSPTRGGIASTGRSTAASSATGQASVNNNRADRGAVNQAIEVKYRICFLSARPIREALARMVIAAQHEPDADLISRLQAFVQRDFSPYIVIAVSIDTTDQRYLGPVMQQINSATAGSLKNKAYLETPDGKRLFISGYQPPIPDGLGAKFIFPRRPNGEEFLKTGTNAVRFVAEFSDSFKMNMRFRVSEMIYDNKLEY
jgi:hypothetical protein